jgi:hypothetical protein
MYFSFRVASRAIPSVVEVSEEPQSTQTYSYDAAAADGVEDDTTTAGHEPTPPGTDETSSDLAYVGLFLIAVGGIGGFVWYRKNQRENARGHRVGSTGLAAMDDVGACHESAIDMELNDAARAAKLSEGSAAWSIRLELSDSEPFALDLPLNSVSTSAELKQAILEACLSRLGPDVTPVSWLNGRFDLMAVQYVDALVRAATPIPPLRLAHRKCDLHHLLIARVSQGTAQTVQPTTSIEEVRSSITLRVTERSDRKP